MESLYEQIIKHTEMVTKTVCKEDVGYNIHSTMCYFKYASYSYEGDEDGTRTTGEVVKTGGGSGEIASQPTYTTWKNACNALALSLQALTTTLLPREAAQAWKSDAEYHEVPFQEEPNEEGTDFLWSILCDVQNNCTVPTLHNDDGRRLHTARLCEPQEDTREFQSPNTKTNPMHSMRQHDTHVGLASHECHQAESCRAWRRLWATATAITPLRTRLTSGENVTLLFSLLSPLFSALLYMDSLCSTLVKQLTYLVLLPLKRGDGRITGFLLQNFDSTVKVIIDGLFVHHTTVVCCFLLYDLCAFHYQALRQRGKQCMGGRGASHEERGYVDVEDRAYVLLKRIISEEPTLNYLITSSTSSAYEIQSIAFSLLKTLLFETRYSAMFLPLERRMDILQHFSQKLLFTHNAYIHTIRHRAFHCLFQFLTDPYFVRVLLAYTQDVNCLKNLLNMFFVEKGCLCFDAFHLIKLFIFNPNKTEGISKLLAQERNGILLQLKVFKRYIASKPIIATEDIPFALDDCSLLINTMFSLRP